MQNFCLSRDRKMLGCLVIVTLIALPLFTAAAQERPVEITISSADIAAATTVSGVRYHLFPARTPAGKAAALDSPGVTFSTPKHPLTSPIASLPSFPAGTGFYPEQFFKVSSTGAVIVSTKSHPIYVNMSSCGGTVALCWGNPAQFLTDLGASSMIHLVDTQYVPSTASNRYTLGTPFSSPNVTIFAGTSGHPTLGENDILQIVHAAAKSSGGVGLGHVYHVFLPKGVDHCLDEGPCYSPDNFGSFAFCAYHFRVKFSDLASPVYYTVEPFQNVGGCQVPPGTPNGQLIDSTDNSLSHELFETITDPDITTGFRSLNNIFGPFEIGDVCANFVFGVTLNTRPYAIQPEYSNKYEACATTP